MTLHLVFCSRTPPIIALHHVFLYITALYGAFLHGFSIFMAVIRALHHVFSNVRAP